MAFHWTLWSSVSKRGTQRTQIFRYPKLPIISWTALCLIPSFVAIASSVSRLSSLMISSRLFLSGSVTIPPADLRSLSLYYYAVCGRMCMSSVCVWSSCLLVICLQWPHVYVICVSLVFLSVGDLLVSNLVKSILKESGIAVYYNSSSSYFIVC